MVDYAKIYDDAVIAALTERVSKMLDGKIREMQDIESSPYINGIDGLAKYLGIGLTLAQELKNKKEIAYSQRGRQIWFKKSDVEKFIKRNRV